MYELQDTVRLEMSVLIDYRDWTNQKLKTVRNAADSEYRKKQEDFYLGLAQEIYEDFLLVDVELGKQWQGVIDIECRREEIEKRVRREVEKRVAERALVKKPGPQSGIHSESESESEGYVTAAESVASPRSDASVDTP